MERGLGAPDGGRQGVTSQRAIRDGVGNGGDEKRCVGRGTGGLDSHLRCREPAFWRPNYTIVMAGRDGNGCDWPVYSLYHCRYIGMVSYNGSSFSYNDCRCC